MSAGATQAACVPRPARTPQAPTNARAPQVFAYPAMARTVKVRVRINACLHGGERLSVYVFVQAALRFQKCLCVDLRVCFGSLCMREHCRADAKAGHRTA